MFNKTYIILREENWRPAENGILDWVARSGDRKKIKKQKIPIS